MNRQPRKNKNHEMKSKMFLVSYYRLQMYSIFASFNVINMQLLTIILCMFFDDIQPFSYTSKSCGIKQKQNNNNNICVEAVCTYFFCSSNARYSSGKI